MSKDERDFAKFHPRHPAGYWPVATGRRQIFSDHEHLPGEAITAAQQASLSPQKFQQLIDHRIIAMVQHTGKEPPLQPTERRESVVTLRPPGIRQRIDGWSGKLIETPDRGGMDLSQRPAK